MRKKFKENEKFKDIAVMIEEHNTEKLLREPKRVRCFTLLQSPVPSTLISNQLKRKDQIRTMLTRSMQLMSDLEIVFKAIVLEFF